MLLVEEVQPRSAAAATSDPPPSSVLAFSLRGAAFIPGKLRSPRPRASSKVQCESGRDFPSRTEGRTRPEGAPPFSPPPASSYRSRGRRAAARAPTTAMAQKRAAELSQNEHLLPLPFPIIDCLHMNACLRLGDVKGCTSKKRAIVALNIIEVGFFKVF